MKNLITIITLLVSTLSYGQRQEIVTISDQGSATRRASVDISKVESERKVEMFSVKAVKHTYEEQTTEVVRGGKIGNLFSNPVKTKTSNPPEIIGGFASGYLNYMPNDDDVAISNEGYIVSMTNGWTVIMDQEGNEIKRLDDNTLFDIADPAEPNHYVNVFDPHVTYDPIRDRWFAVIDQVQYERQGNSAVYDITSGKISIAFSQTNDPNGSWNIYDIPTYHKIHNLDVALDYPEIAFTKSEIIITGNLTQFTNTGTRHTIIFQIPFANGYAGDDIDYATHILQDRAGYRACGNAFGYNSDKLYFIHSSASPPSLGTKTLELAVLDGSISQGGKIGYVYNLNLDKYYYRPLNAGQPNSRIDLSIDNSVFRSAFADNNVIYAVQTSWQDDKALLYYTVIELDTTDLEFSKISSKLIEDSTLHLAFASIAPTGIKGANGINAVAIATCFSSEQTFPGLGVFYVTSDGQVSDMSVCKAGESRLAWYAASPARWGDYSDIVRRYNYPGELWVAGGYGRSDTRSGSWLSRINVNTFSAGIPDNTESKSRTYPNPAQSILSSDFMVNHADLYSANLIDLSGKEVHLKTAFLKQGIATIGADISDVANGVYFLRIGNSSGVEVLNKKVIIQH